MVTINLSDDDDLVAEAQAYAHARNTTINQLIRDYLRRLTRQIPPDLAAEEFAELARHHSGHSEEGFVFQRREAHLRGKDAAP